MNYKTEKAFTSSLFSPYQIRDIAYRYCLYLRNILVSSEHATLSFLFQSLANEIVYITRPMDKKKIMFYNDKTANLSIDEEFQKLWRSVAVENMDDQKIEEYLEKQVRLSMCL